MCAERRFVPALAAARPRARGQALVETLVATIVLVPLVLLVVWLGKVQSLRQASISASRTLAFECTARPDTCADPAGGAQLADEVRRRAFSRVDAGILSADRLPDDAPSGERNPLWVDRANRPLLERFSDVGVRVDRERFDAGASLVGSRAGSLVADAAAFLAERAGPGRFGLDLADGLVDAKVQANVSATRTATDFLAQLDSIPLRVKAHTAVLTDAWNASGPYGSDARSVQSRVDRGQQILAAYDASIDARYLPTRGFIELMSGIGLEPAGDAFRYHAADVDVVPADRLGGSGAAARYGHAPGAGGSGAGSGW